MSLTNWEKKQRKEEYDRYMMSPVWTHKRFEVFRRDGYMCQICHTNQASQVHHKTYKNFEDESLDDLMAVCKPCHDKHYRQKAGGR